MAWKILYLRYINSLILVCLAYAGLYVQPLLAAPSVSCVADLFQTLDRQLLLHGYGRHPKSIRRVLALTGLRDKDIKDSVILDVGSYFTEEFVPYTKREMGAKQALLVHGINSGVPQHFFLKMYPLFAKLTNGGELFGFIPPFQQEQIWQQLGGAYADITLSLAVIGKHSLPETEFWLQQLARVTKGKGVIIFDFGKQGAEKENVSREELEDILLRMKEKSIITSYETQHTNKNTGWYGASVTYKLVKGVFQPHARLRELQRNDAENSSATGVVIPFPNNK